MRFKLQISYTDYWLWVVIHDTAEELRAAALNHDIKQGTQANSIGGAYNVVRGITHRAVDGTRIGTLRLSRDDMPVEVVAHELFHAVVWAFRQKYHSANLGRGWAVSWREERVAYMYGETLQRLVGLIHKKGLWD